MLKAWCTISSEETIMLPVPKDSGGPVWWSGQTMDSSWVVCKVL